MSTSRSSAGSFGALPSPYDGNTVPTTPTSSRSRENYLDLSTEPSIDGATQSSTASHNHWCFICRNPRVITTCDGWKRHMKEHETRYRCMPNGPIEYTADGTRCAFCGVRDPSQDHCDTHKAFPCANRSLDVRSYTRKPHFITHLKTHHISNYAERADHWKETINKKHFSCGFCVSHFYSLIEQQNHIYNAHYRLFQHIQDWDFSKVIRGLLLQPGVVESWRRILALHPLLMESRLHWDSSEVKNLQFRLEMGGESPEALAAMAFNESKYDSSHQGEAETVDATGLLHHGGVEAPQQSPVTQATAPIQFSLNESTVSDGDMRTSSASHVEQPGTWAVPNNSISSRNYLDVSDGSQEDTTMELHYPYLDTSQRLMRSGDNHRPEPEPSLPTSWFLHDPQSQFDDPK